MCAPGAASGLRRLLRGVIWLCPMLVTAALAPALLVAAVPTASCAARAGTLVGSLLMAAVGTVAQLEIGRASCRERV